MYQIADFLRVFLLMSLLHTSSANGDLCCSLHVLFIDLFICFFNHRVQQVRLDQWEIEATLDPQAHLVSKVYPELQERKEPR